ncbi:MAG: acyltransferase family protein, partial [Prevotella sp.]
ISIISLTIGSFGYYLNVLQFNLPLWIDSAMTAMPFFLFGHLIKQYSSILNDRTKPKHIIFALLSAVTLLLVYLYNIHHGKNIISYGDNIFDINIICLFLGGISGTYIIFIISKCVNSIPILSYIGRYSIVVLLTHLIFLFVIRNILYQLHINQSSILLNFWVFATIILVSIPTITICIKYLPYWFAQKNLFN